jgi:hypothetical protein
MLKNYKMSVDKQHTKQFSDLLSGKTVRAVRRLDEEEMKMMMWYKNPLVLIFSDGTQLILQCDDEGNDGGAGFYYDGKNNIQETIYTI